jgi:hypothetical protein
MPTRNVVWIVLAIAFFAPPAVGQPEPEVSTPPPNSDSNGGMAQARTAFQEGIALAKAERWELALEALERSAALYPHAITAYNMGYCERQLEHWTRARKMLAKALADHRMRGGVELPVELVSAAETYWNEADHQVARVIVTITAGAIGVDGRPLELAASDGPRPVLLAGTRKVGPPEVAPSVTFEVVVDPGTHAFVLSTKDQADVTVNENLAPGSQMALDLRLPDPAQATKLAAPSETEVSPGHEMSHLPALVAFGVGAAGLALGTVSGLVAFEKKGDVREACRATDLVRCRSERESGNRAADISTGSFIGGGVAVAVGMVLLLTAAPSTTRSTSKGATTRPVVRPFLGWVGAGVAGLF